ncbi:hypothetical protein [Caenimonas aquaedulcis]|uniref:Uncharacterized protein n=1 Tax=Caenimonas aquaedulcis TaxID=2793270 RepID=A0A931H4M0_9BURK|nr:hypothetical protein [Caenimonas aquaedulcis]MBG9388540.1 hypothetical protein [Caenimonas aquaedulcis]
MKISVVVLGNMKYPVNTEVLEKWRSKIFEIRHGASVGFLPNTDGPNWERTDDQLLEVLKADPSADMTVGIIDAPLEDNFYMRRLSNNVGVLSLHEMADIVRYSNFSIEQYILRNLYELAVLAKSNGGLITTDYASWAHDEIRGCIFDMNAVKSDIVFSLDQPILCPACRVRANARQLPAQFLPLLDRELRRIRKPTYARMTEWVQFHPITAICITAVSAITLNLVASFIYDRLKQLFE